jgi:DNA-binding transcriptional ArsR family regulator
MKNIIIAPVGDTTDSVFMGIREFHTHYVVLIVDQDRKDHAEKLRKDLERFKIPTLIKPMDTANLWEDLFRIVGETKKEFSEYELIMDVASGTNIMNCASTSAAFVNGIRAYGVENDHIILLPVLKFSYYKLITDKKMDILRLLSNHDCCSSLEELAKRTSMSLPLVSYHINGNLKSEGLRDLGLVETIEVKGKLHIQLSTMGDLLVKGYVSPVDVKAVEKAAS